MIVELTPSAESDLFDAALAYELEREGLGGLETRIAQLEASVSALQSRAATAPSPAPTAPAAPSDSPPVPAAQPSSFAYPGEQTVSDWLMTWVGAGISS